MSLYEILILNVSKEGIPVYVHRQTVEVNIVH